MSKTIIPDFQRIFESVPGCYLILSPDRNFTILAVSDAYLEATKTVREHILGKKLFTVFPDNPADLHATGVKNLTVSLQTVLRTGNAHSMSLQKYDIPRPVSEGGGFEERYWSPRNMPVLKGNGGVLYIVHSVVDVTKQVMLEKSLGGMDRLFSLALDMFCTAGFDGYFKLLNPAWERTLGWTREELLSRPYEDFIHPDDRASTTEEAMKISRGAATLSFQNRYRHKDGSYRWFEWSAIPVIKESLIYAIARDRTSQKLQEAEIERTRAFLDSIIENIPDMIFVKDAEKLRFLLFNKAGEELLGYPRSSMIGKNDADFFPKEEADFFTQKDHAVLAKKQLLDIPSEPIQTRSRGERILHTKKIPILDKDGHPKYLLGISEDITERTREEKARAEFVTLVSHQLRTPLTAMRWSFEILKERLTHFSATEQRLLSQSYTAMLNMAQTISTMLAVAHIDTRKIVITLSNFRLTDVIRSLVEEYNAETKNRRLELTLNSPRKFRMQSDATLLREIFANLLDNAIQYTPDGGKITIRIRQKDQQCVVTVTDSGIGISKTAQGSIFEKLFRGENAKKMKATGSGLGLYVVRSLVTVLGGTVSCTSTEGQGANFTVCLPLVPPT